MVLREEGEEKTGISIHSVFRLCFFVMLFMVAGCWSSLAAGGADVKTVGMLVGAGGLGDQSYNDMTFSGLGKARKKFGFHLIVAETVDTSDQAREQALHKLLNGGADIIVASGTGLIDLVMTYSGRYPEKIFLVNDCRLEGFSNVASTMFAHQEGSYLVGMLAASVSNSGKIGFIGGVNLPIINTFLEGFRRGATRSVPGIEVTAQYISQPPDYSGFESPEKGFNLAEEMYAEGIDIIFSVAGLTGNGVIQAADRVGKLVIGVDANQDHMAVGHVLTSMMKRLDRATYLEITKIIQGDFLPGVTYYNLANGGISLTPMKYTRHLVPDTALKAIRLAEKDIIDGKIIFP